MASSPDQDGEPDKPPVTEELPVAEKHYPRLLVSNLNPRSSRVVLKQYFEGYQGGQLKVLDAEMFRTGEGHSAIVTLDNPSGEVQGILGSMQEHLLNEQSQLHYLYTESTTLTISGLEQRLQEKAIMLARRWNVDCKPHGSNNLSLTGPIELVYHLRLELDMCVMQACGASNIHLLPDSVTPPPPVQSHVHQPLPLSTAELPTTELPPSPPPPTSDSPHMFSNLSPEVLALLAKIPEGDLPGVQYRPKEGTVNIESRSKEELEDRISRFQTAYQGILGARKLKVEPVEVPPALDDAIAEQITASFNKQYNQCVFIYYMEPRVVKVVSTSSRQFDQAKKLLVEELTSRPDPSVGAKVEFSRKEEVIVLPDGRKLTLKKANIVEEEVDVIVNAANSHLQHGGGVAGAINAASRGSVQKYSNAYVSQKGEIPVGQVAVTHAGGALKCKQVVHAVGPDRSHSYGECEHLLTQVINSTLSRVEKANNISIAIPAISSGIFGVNKELVARCIVDAILNFRFTKAPPALSDIRIVIIDKATYSCFARYFVQKRVLLKQAPMKPLEPHESQSAGVGQWGHPNTSAAPVSEPPSLEQNPSHPPMSVSADMPQELVDLKPEGNPKPEDNLSPPSVAETPFVLTFNDLPVLSTRLRSISPKWSNLGFYLGLTIDELNHLVPTVEANCDAAVYLNKVLSAWLQRTNPNPPTLEELCRALSHAAIGEEKLAMQLLQLYRAQITGTEGSKPVDANAVSNNSVSVPAKEEVKIAANTTPLVLTPNDLSALSAHLRSVSSKWDTLGLKLGFTTEMLAKLVPLNYDPAVHLNQVLSTWLQLANPPTLDALCMALSDATVGEEKLAEWLLHSTRAPAAVTEGNKPVDANAISNISIPASAKPERKLAVHFPPRDGSDCSATSNEQPPSSSHPSGHGQPLTEAHGTGMTSIPNIPAGSTPIPEHLQSSHAGTDLSSAGPGYTVNFQSMSNPASSTWVVPSTATSGTMTYSQATAAGGGSGGVPVPTTVITQQPQKQHGKEDKHRGGSGGGNKGHGSHGPHHDKGKHRSKSSSAAEEDKECPICLDVFKNPVRTKCGHVFCSTCITKALQYDSLCPTCKHALQPIVGKQPKGGKMSHQILYGQHLPGYKGYNTIQIHYSIPGGVQGPEHPNPGQRFSGTSRTAFLPDTYEGREVLKLLKKAFDARLIFTVGTSVTSGIQNTVVWNDIHHKTNMSGGASAYGYPDPTYLQRVKADLAAKGIVPVVHTSDSTSTRV